MIVKRSVLTRRLQVLLPPLFLGCLALYALWPWLPLVGQRTPTRTIVFYGFSILGEVMTEAIFPAFEQEWLVEHGEQLEFISSFAGSGTVTNQVVMGVPADMALLSLELDAKRLAEEGVVPAESWRQLPHGGVVNRTPFIILVRKGNPKQIQGFADLARPGVGVIHPDPLTSGAANWALVAEYGAGERTQPDNPQAGYEMLRGIWRNVTAQAPSARAARTQFQNGFGDALITYEQEVLYDRARGRLEGEIVYPPHTILSEHTLVVIEKNVEPEEQALIEAFVDFLWSEQAQRLFVQYGFRSVDERLNEGSSAFGAIEDPFYIGEFGGWTVAKQEIVDALWRDRVLKELGR